MAILHVDIHLGLLQQLHHFLVPIHGRPVERHPSIDSPCVDIRLGLQQQHHH